jgi:hypothetical protein
MTLSGGVWLNCVLSTPIVEQMCYLLSRRPAFLNVSQSGKIAQVFGVLRTDSCPLGIACCMRPLVDIKGLNVSEVGMDVMG